MVGSDDEKQRRLIEMTDKIRKEKEECEKATKEDADANTTNNNNTTSQIKSTVAGGLSALWVVLIVGFAVIIIIAIVLIVVFSSPTYKQKMREKARKEENLVSELNS
jgi:hypothetical protein